MKVSMDSTQIKYFVQRRGVAVYLISYTQPYIRSNCIVSFISMVMYVVDNFFLYHIIIGVLGNQDTWVNINCIGKGRKIVTFISMSDKFPIHHAKEGLSENTHACLITRHRRYGIPKKIAQTAWLERKKMRRNWLQQRDEVTMNHLRLMWSHYHRYTG